MVSGSVIRLATKADSWTRVVQARTHRDDLVRHRIWALRKDGHEAAIDLRAVPRVGAELVLSVDGELRRARLYCAHEQAELSGAIANPRAMFEARDASLGPSVRLVGPGLTAGAHGGHHVGTHER